MSASDPVLVTGVDPRGVARVELAREAARNAMDEELIDALARAFGELAREPAVRALVLSGRGKAFSAGADVGWMRRSAGHDEEANRADAARLTGMLERLAAFPRPTLALVHGAAYGGAVGLAAAVDIAIAARSARFALSEVRLGLEPAMIAPYVASALGPRRFLALALTGRPFDAEEALACGLVHEVTDDDGLAAAGERVLDDLLKGAPEAQAGIKELARLSAGLGPGNARGPEMAARTAARRAGAEGQEGLSAFLEKRPPAWTGD